MPRDSSLVAARNKDIRKAYERLIAEESIVVCKGIKVSVRLNYQQVITVLGTLFYLSPRTVEPIVTAYATKMAPILTAGQPSQQAHAQ